MRTTIDLPDDLHRIVTSLATHTRRSISGAAVDLMRRGLAQPAAAIDPATLRFHASSGLPVVHLARTVTPEDVAATEDEA
jgi:predicted transcriptional regulator